MNKCFLCCWPVDMCPLVFLVNGCLSLLMVSGHVSLVFWELDKRFLAAGQCTSVPLLMFIGLVLPCCWSVDKCPLAAGQWTSAPLSACKEVPTLRLVCGEVPHLVLLSGQVTLCCLPVDKCHFCFWSVFKCPHPPCCWSAHCLSFCWW